MNCHLYRVADGEPVPATLKIEKLNPRVELALLGEVALADIMELRAARGRRSRSRRARQRPAATPGDSWRRAHLNWELNPTRRHAAECLQALLAMLVARAAEPRPPSTPRPS